ncbi:receptor-like protein EIX1 [Aegilops tauschii subsp. strangulata]
MRRTINLLLALISISIFSFFTNDALQPQHPHAHGGGCIPTERAALLSFKKGITSDSTNLLTSWDSQDCCQWRGIGCNNRTGHVVKLHLRSTIVEDNPWGYYDPCEHDNSLFGEISPSLLSLKHLEHLDLSMNCLPGPNSKILNLMGSMTNLRYLDLSGIPFTGRVPSQLGNLSKLQYLDLAQTGNSMMYSTDINWLAKLPFLKFLSMSGVQLSGIPDWPHTLNMIPPLRVIHLSSCSLDSANQSLLHLNLTKLEKLDLSSNDFEHSLTSGWFWKATSLKYLDLGENRLFGQLPDTLGNMTYLQVLDISRNENKNMMMTGYYKNLCSLEILDLSVNSMNGDIAVLMKSLPQCTWKKLQELDFSINNFTGTLPDFISEFTRLSILYLYSNNLVGTIPPQIGNMTGLTSLALYNNQLTGSIPANLGKLMYMSELLLSSNLLSGTVPTEIGSLINLNSLALRENNFTGVITEEHFANLTSLRAIDISSNNLKIVLSSDWRPPVTLKYASFGSCQMGPLFPPWLQQLKTTGLDISSNGLKGEFPDWFWSAFSHATSLDISNNQISGSLPADLDRMAFKKLVLNSNRFTGPIPALPNNITWLDISNNKFSETIPSNLGASLLEVLSVHSNQIGGYIPESICKLEWLVYLDLSNNILEGEIPQCFEIHNIQFFILNNNSLSGKMPAFLQNNTGLKFLDLSWNKFSGRLPTWIGKLVNLHFLILSHNNFSDNIPVDITELGYLRYLDLSGNSFSGAIPQHLLNLTFMRTLQQESVGMDGSVESHGTTNLRTSSILNVEQLGHILSVQTKGQQLVYLFGRTLAYFVSIDLSCNSLTGEIPTYITSLAALMNMNLSSNQLSGEIPSMIGTMQSLVSLDLSQNKLSGEIPSSLSNLTSLAALNLSYNSLSGRIPSGRQLDTLNSENPSLMYIGNNGLCGPPVHKNCSGNDPFIHGDLRSSNQEFDPLTFHFGLVLGFVVGLWMVFCALLFKKTWRIAYFRFFDKVYDHVYVFVVVKWAGFAKKTDEE